MGVLSGVRRGLAELVARTFVDPVSGASVNRTLWPPTEPRTLTRQVWDEGTARSIPSVAKALHVHQLAGLMDLDAFRGPRPVPGSRPRLLEQPDLTAPGSTWFIQQAIHDWLVCGNALTLTTVRSVETGLPLAVRWFPAGRWSILADAGGNLTGYQLNGVTVDRVDVTHVRRGHALSCHARGIGIVEQHLDTLDRSGLETEASRQTLRAGSVPSVAVIAPGPLDQPGEADEAADAWERKLGGPARRPAILPNGTQVIPLGFSATDQQAIEARKMTLIDVANLTGLDPYWLGAPGSSHTYRSPGPLWLSLLRMTLEPMLRSFEDGWSEWLVRGQRVRFNRDQLTADDRQTTVETAAKARAANLWTYEESRIAVGMDPDVPEPKGEPVAVAPPAADEQQDQADDTETGPAGSGDQQEEK